MIAGIDEFLAAQPRMGIVCSKSSGLLLNGKFKFCAVSNGFPEIIDTYELQISVPPDYPNSLPKVVETGKRIPRDGNHHINANDDSLCLGSSIKIHQILSGNQTLCGFAQGIITPFLYAMSLKLDFGIDFIFGELKHGREGIFQDYMDMFGLSEKRQVLETLQLLIKRQKDANEIPCPCGCNKRFGKCPFRRKLKKIRNRINTKVVISELKFLKDSRN